MASPGDKILAEISERRLASLVMEMITTENEEKEKEDLREILSCVMKDIVSDESDDPDMISTLLQSEAIRTCLTVFAAAEDQEQRRQARRVLDEIIRDTEGAHRLGQRLVWKLSSDSLCNLIIKDD